MFVLLLFSNWKRSIMLYMDIDYISEVVSNFVNEVRGGSYGCEK